MSVASLVDTFSLTIGGVTRDVPLVRLASNRRLPLVEFLGDTQLCEAAARELQKLLPDNAEVLFTCETSSIPLVHDLAQISKLPYEVARKRRRPYMNDPLIQEVASMTLGVGETLWLDLKRYSSVWELKCAVLDLVTHFPNDLDDRLLAGLRGDARRCEEVCPS